MIEINNYISDIKQSIISCISSSSLKTKVLITSQFNKIDSSISSPIISIYIDKISILPMSLGNYISNIHNLESEFYKTDIDLYFYIYVPAKLGANTCYDIFHELSKILLKNLKNISILSINCNKIEFQRSNNNFLLPAFVPISIIPV